MQVWGALVILTVCPLLGGLPLIDWIILALTGRSLKQQGTGNVSVSAAFYHGGRLAGILAVLSEAAKGILAVLLARFLFPETPAWELLALMALVVGRYGMAKGAGTTNVVWGAIAHDPEVAGLVFLIGTIGFTIFRERRLGRLGLLVLFPLITILLRPQQKVVGVAAIALCLLLAWIYQQIPDDLDLPVPKEQGETRTMFRFFRGDRAAVSLSERLDARVVGEKAATLSLLKRWGYAVPAGWVLLPGDDPEALIEFLQPSAENPLVVRSTAVGEDSQRATAAGQYASFLNITSNSSLQQAIVGCLNSYDRPAAVEYRRSRNLPEASMAVLIQTQVRGVFSGVAFSRDPVKRHGDEVVIEALPGDATRVVSGQETPEQYRVVVLDGETTQVSEMVGDVPPELIHDVAILARQLENQYHGIPQDIEWSYDGQQLWVLQSRPIGTMLPIWTRKIAAEVIPGSIRPLTWSINRPLTCGVWGEIFTIVLGKAAALLDFEETATLQYSRAYFNASLLGEIFLRMGLPPESLEFLTRGAKFSKPPLMSTIKQLPGLLRLLRREWNLEQDFERDYSQEFAPKIERLHDISAESVGDSEALLARIDGILTALKRATYYSILAPLSLALRQAVLKVPDAALDYSLMPEVAAARSLNEIAIAARHLLPELETLTPETIFGTLSEIPDGQTVLEQFQQFLSRYGYLSEAATDIATPRWQEDPKPVRNMFVQQIGTLFMAPIESGQAQGLKAQVVQARLNLKGRVTEVYNQLLAELRWSFVALEQVWLRSGILQSSGDIFFLQIEEIRSLITGTDKGELSEKLPQLIASRRSQWQQDQKLTTVPYVVYGNAPPAAILNSTWNHSSMVGQQLRGIGASPGQVEGEVKILRNWQDMPDINRNHILVVPYTDAGWSPLLARAGGLVAEVGGRLSHGAIVAREYGIPAVMDVHDATIKLQDGQRLRIDGQLGTVEIIIANS